MRYCVVYERNGVTIQANFDSLEDAMLLRSCLKTEEQELRIKDLRIFHLESGEFDPETGYHSGGVTLLN